MALGGNCLADVDMLRAEPAVFGPVASDPTVSRLISKLASGGQRVLACWRNRALACRAAVVCLLAEILVLVAAIAVG